MDINEFLNQKDKSKVKDNSLKNFKTANKQKNLDKFLELNFEIGLSLKEQKNHKRLTEFK